MEGRCIWVLAVSKILFVLLQAASLLYFDSNFDSDPKNRPRDLWLCGVLWSWAACHVAVRRQTILSGLKVRAEVS